MADLRVSDLPGRAGIAGLILAGGQGVRMNGQDKGLALLRGEPLAAHVARRLAPQVGRLIVSANRHQDRYAEYGEVVRDGEPELGDWQGPLLGVAAGLAAMRGETWLVVAPCDTPFLPLDLASRLIGAAVGVDAPLAFAAAGGRRHPVCMALRGSLLPCLLDFLRGGDRKVGLWQAEAGGVEVRFDDAPEAFININTPQELASAERRAASAAKET